METDINSNIKKFFLDKKWDFIHIEGSPLGNTSFLLNFLKNVLLSEPEDFFDKVMGHSKSFLFIRSQEIPEDRKQTLSDISEIKKNNIFEFVMNEDIFNYRELLRSLGNRKYTHLIIDEVRKNESMENFNEVMDFCKTSGIKVIVSTTNSRAQKLAYSYYDSDLIFTVHPFIFEKRNVIEIQDLKNNVLKKFNMSL